MAVKMAVLTIVVSLKSGYMAKDAMTEILEKGRKLRTNLRIKESDTRNIFVGINSGREATFELIFIDGGTPGTSIPDVSTVTDYLEKLEAVTYTLAAISQEFQHFNKYY